MAAPRNRLVLRLLAEMEDRRSSWTDLVCADDGLPESEREAFRTTLHERIQEIIALPPLSTATAGSYHRLGLMMLNDATGAGGLSGYERHPAFQRGGEFLRPREYGEVVCRRFGRGLEKCRAARRKGTLKVSENFPQSLREREARNAAR